jgi:transposase
MAEPLPLALRERIVAAYNRGGFTYASIAELFGVGEASVSRLLSRSRKADGDLTPAPRGGGNPPRIPEEQYDALRALVADAPDARQEDLCELWEAHFGVVVSKSAMGRTLNAAGITRKKSSSVRGSSRGRTSSRSGRRSKNG